MYLVAGLGNPGPRYRQNRHNVGFMLVDRIAQQAGQSLDLALPRSVTCSLQQAGERVILAKPQTFMNLSGEAVLELLRHHPVDLSQLLIVYDDIDLPLGKIRIRPSGSSGGQRGMESIIQALGTQQVPRLRIGISQDHPPEDYSEYVLSDFDKEERVVLDEVFGRAVLAIETTLSAGLEQAMTLYNSPAG